MLCKPQDSLNPWIDLWGRVSGFSDTTFVVVDHDRLHIDPPDVLLDVTPDARVDINVAPKQSTDFFGQNARKESKQSACWGRFPTLHPPPSMKCVGNQEQDSLRCILLERAKDSQTGSDPSADPVLSG